MAEIVPVDQFLDWYPGWTPELTDEPVGGRATGAVHQGRRGALLVRRLPLAARLLAARLPLRHRLLDVGHADRGALAAAASGQGPRAAHSADRSPTSRRCRPPRSGSSASAPRASSATCPPFLQNFDAIWDERKWELELGLQPLRELRLRRQVPRRHRPVPHRRPHVPPPGVGDPLRADVPAARHLPAALRPVRGQRHRPGQRRRSSSRVATRASWRPTARCGTSSREAERLGIADLFDNEPEQIRDVLAKAGGNASVWLTKFDDFLKVLRLAHRGHRRHQHPVVDREPGVAARPDPQLPVDGRAARLREGRGRGASTSATRPSTRPARSSRGETLGAFDELLAINQVANFAWWNEDHNYYIDLRASIPLRRGALALGAGLRRRHLRRRPLPLLPRGHRRGRRSQAVEGPAVDRHGPPRVLRPLQRDPRHPAEGRRHAARQDRGPGAHRDLRHAPPLLRGAEGRRRRHRAHGLPGLGRHGAGAGPGDGVGHRAVRCSRRTRSWCARRPRRTGRPPSPSSPAACATAAARSPTPPS